MNTTAIKKLSMAEKSGFTRSFATEQEDVVAMITSIKLENDPEKSPPNKKSKPIDKPGDNPYSRKQLYSYRLLPFVKETKYGLLPLKIGDMKQ